MRLWASRVNRGGPITWRVKTRWTWVSILVTNQVKFNDQHLSAYLVAVGSWNNQNQYQCHAHAERFDGSQWVLIQSNHLVQGSLFFTFSRQLTF